MGNDAAMENVDAFRTRARAWLETNLPRLPEGVDPQSFARHDEAGWARARELQRVLFEGGFAGLCFPKEYGGQGLTLEHQRAFNQECAGYEMPLVLNIPTLTILAATLVDFGTEEQKHWHLPAILRGDEIWVQMLSEPTGGSDLAGCLTRATRDGDMWIVSGSKIWSSSAYAADYALLLARTDWDVPKHRGLTMFIVQIHQAGIHIDQIRQVDGSMEFCQEFFDDVALTRDAVVGDANDGWTVASQLLHHERNAVGGASPYSSGPGLGRRARTGPPTDLLDAAHARGVSRDSRIRQLVGEAYSLACLHEPLADRITSGVRSGKLPGPAGALLKLYTATTGVRRATIALEVAGAAAAAWRDGDELAEAAGVGFLARQASCLAGGSNEMQRNIISERVLGMPREFAADRDVPFSEVKRNVVPVRPR
jgi:alkylation response protein AidB-like acyl-CoA dehydrogenase